MQASDEEETLLRRETAQLLHERAGARARVEANRTAIFDITGKSLLLPLTCTVIVTSTVTVTGAI